MIKSCWLVVCFCWGSLICSAQLSSDEQKRIDMIFDKWAGKDLPGYSIAITKNGKQVYSKGYGAANLEYGIPNNPSTIFHIASESKQYTAFCMVLLARQGKLAIDDDVRKYLPYVPDFGKTITIRHLITHTSGLRDQWQALNIAGWQSDDVITQAHVVKMVSRQKDLNFAPGERMLYCNTGYTLMAEIVKKVTGKTLRRFAADEIFRPLGMTNTHFHDNHTEIVRNRAYSYRPLDSLHFANAPLNYATVGATSLFTTVEDEAKWLINYETGKVGGKEAIEQMYEKGVLNNDTALDYAFGLTIDSYKGWKRIGHGGADAGYRSYTCRLPEAGLGFIVFSNMSTGSCQAMAMKMADVLVKAKTLTEPPPAKVSFDTPPPKPTQTYAPLLPGELAALAGIYYSDELEAVYEIVFADNKLVIKHRKYGDSKLEYTGNMNFTTDYSFMKYLCFSKDSNGSTTGFEVNSGRVLHLKFRKINKI